MNNSVLIRKLETLKKITSDILNDPYYVPYQSKEGLIINMNSIDSLLNKLKEDKSQKINELISELDKELNSSSYSCEIETYDNSYDLIITFHNCDHIPNKEILFKDKRCGNCKYIGAATGDVLYIRGNIHPLHFCENEKTPCKACLGMATGCMKFEPQEESEKQE